MNGGWEKVKRKKYHKKEASRELPLGLVWRCVYIVHTLFVFAFSLWWWWYSCGCGMVAQQTTITTPLPPPPPLMPHCRYIILYGGDGDFVHMMPGIIIDALHRGVSEGVIIVKYKNTHMCVQFVRLIMHSFIKRNENEQWGT